MASGSKNTILDTPDREAATVQAAREATEEMQRREVLIAKNSDLYESFLKSLEQKEELGKGGDHSPQREKGPRIDLTRDRQHQARTISIPRRRLRVISPAFTPLRI